MYNFLTFFVRQGLPQHFLLHKKAMKRAARRSDRLSAPFMATILLLIFMMHVFHDA